MVTLKNPRTTDAEDTALICAQCEDEPADVCCPHCGEPMCVYCCHHGHADLSDDRVYVAARAALAGRTLTRAEAAREIMALNAERVLHDQAT